MSYAKLYNLKTTPQSESVPGRDIVVNNAGGFVFALDDWKRLDRWLILGSDAPTYYASAKKLTRENADCVLRCLKQDGKRVVDTIIDVSDSGRAPKNDTAIFGLALAFMFGDRSTKQGVEVALPKVCRIPTHLFHFNEYLDALDGKWNRSRRRLVANWYLGLSVEKLAYEIVKYQGRDGWANRDMLCLAHPKATDTTNAIFKYIMTGESNGTVPSIIAAFEQAKKAIDAKEVVKLIREYDLPRECVPTMFLKNTDVWAALLEKMPVTAMIRNLATMTRIGLLRPLSDTSSKVTRVLTNIETLKKGRVHPLAVLVALNTYSMGHGVRSVTDSYEPVQQVIDALNEAFYLAFGTIEPANKRTLLALDTSGSMTWDNIAGMTGVTPAIGAAAMSMVAARTEPEYHILSFCNTLNRVNISKSDRLDKVQQEIQRVGGGGTDCSLPMLWAAENKVSVDTFQIYTDNETWAGRMHPFQALKNYRQKSGINAKMIVVGMTSTGFTIADPDDGGCLDVVGFDTSAPQVMNHFAR